MREEEFCKVLCQVDLKAKDVEDFKRVIKEQYHHNWIIDNLPAASILDSDMYSTTSYVGFPIGTAQIALKDCFNALKTLTASLSV